MGRVRRLLPSRAMERELEEMWCDGIKGDAALFEEIKSKVVTKCDVPSLLLCVPSLYPRFLDKLMDYVNVTQDQVDMAWLDAAVDVLGRPAMRQYSAIDS